MRVMKLLAAAGALLLLSAPTSMAQSAADTRNSIYAGAKPGDRLTVTTDDGREFRGRLISITPDTIVLRGGSLEEKFDYSRIHLVTRRKNGILVGALIGVGAGLAIGAPLRTRFNNEGSNGDGLFALFVGLGTVAGIGIDAAMPSEKVVFQRTRPAALHLQQARRGVALVWTASW